MPRVVLFNKPFNVLSQFTASIEGYSTLADHLDVKNLTGFYPAGRLDYDSEGLLLLTDNGQLQNRICAPEQKMPKTYWVQVEGIPSSDALKQLKVGVVLKDGLTAPAKVNTLEEPRLWPRNPPIRQRQSIPTCWLELEITEGRNRQVRRMTAAIGHPTLRLIRVKIGPWSLGELQPGEYSIQNVHLAPPSKNPRKSSAKPRSKRLIR